MRIEELVAKILDDNKNLDRYQVALAVAKRSDQLLNGAKSQLSINVKNIKVADLALMELAEGLIVIDGFIDKE